MKGMIKKQNLKGLGKFLGGAAAGFSFFWITSHPKSKIKNKFPEKSIKNFQYFPNAKIIHKNKSYHFHHWFIFSLLYFPFLAIKKFRRSRIMHGLMLGSIFQGLTYRDRFKIIKKEK